MLKFGKLLYDPPISVTIPGGVVANTYTSVNAEHPEKAIFAIVKTFSGIVIWERDVHPQKV